MGFDHTGALRLHHLLALMVSGMAIFFRLVCAVLVAVFSLSVHALVPSQAGSLYYFSIAPYNARVSTPDAACANALAYLRAQSFSAGVVYSLTSINLAARTCVITSPQRGNDTQSFGTVAAQICPANSVTSGSACACNSGYQEDPTHTSCTAIPTSADKWKAWCLAAINQVIGPKIVPGRMVPYGCLGDIDVVGSPVDTPGYKAGDVPAGGGCSFYFDGTGVSMQNDAKAYETHGTGVLTGLTCMQGNAPIPVDAPPNTEQQPPSTPDPCPDGFAGMLNGSTVCAKREPDKGIEGVQGTEVKAADGTSTITKETTKCDGGQCTTTKETTTKDASGAQVGTVKVETTKQSIGAKCAADPGNKVCAAVGMGEGEGGGSFTGNCASGFVVKGEDPILNAMALEQYKRNCKFFENDTDSQSTVNKIRNGTDTQNADAMKAAAASAPVTIQTFDSDGRGWGRACPPNPVIPLVFVNKSFEIPFSRICLPLQAFAAAGVALTMLGSFVWVMGGKK